MTDKLIEQIKADRDRPQIKRKSGGHWRVVHSEYPGILNITGLSFIPTVVTTATDLNGEDFIARNADARRIARVPEMEARILADADVIERWRSMWEKEQTHNEQLIAERDHYKARAERAEEALYRIQNMSYGKNAAVARATLAQIDAEPDETENMLGDFDDEAFTIAYLKGVVDGKAEPRQPTVQEAAQAIMQSKEARDTAFEAVWSVAEKHNLEATNSGGARYSITGDVVNEVYYAALRALAEGHSQ